MYKFNCILGMPLKRYAKPRYLPMKLSLALMLAGTLQVSAFTYGQKITMHKKNVRLETVLKELQVQSGYNVVYDSSILPASATVSVSFEKAELTDALKNILRSYPVEYRVVDKNIVLSPKKTGPKARVAGAAVQQLSVNGKVVS